MALTKVKYDMIDDEAKLLLAGDGSAASETTADVIASSNIGYIDAGETVPTGTNLQEFLEKLLTTTFYPTFGNPSASLASSGTPYAKEIGSTVTPTLTATYTAGTIKGVKTNNVWMPNSLQAAWTGAATEYSFSGSGITGIDNNGNDPTYTVESAQTIGNSGLSYTVAVNYAAGTVYALNSVGTTVDAEGDPYLVGASGTVSATVSFSGYRNMFYGISSASTDVPTNDATATSIVRALASASASPANGTTFTLSPVVGTRRVMFAYPATLGGVTLRDVTSVIDSGTGYNIKESFTKVTYNVEGANGFTGISYKIYYFVPPAAFSAATTYSVTI